MDNDEKIEAEELLGTCDRLSCKLWRAIALEILKEIGDLSTGWRYGNEGRHLLAIHQLVNDALARKL